jgi:hypothetical protein
VASPKPDGILPFGPIYHFLGESFDHIPSQDAGNLILARPLCLIRSFAAGNKLFSKSLSGMYEFSLTSPLSLNYLRRRSIPLNEAQKRF